MMFAQSISLPQSVYFFAEKFFAERNTLPKVALYLPIYVFADRIITK